MVNFLKLFFGGEAESSRETGQPTVESRREDQELSQLRESKFRQAFTEHLGRSLSDEEFLLAKHQVEKDPDGAFPRLTAEEIRVKVLDVARALGWNPEFVPVGDVYAPMGNRQGTFEKALNKALGGDMTAEDLQEARAIFEDDERTKGAWDKMFHHEVVRYADSVAERIISDRLRRTDYGVAAK